MDPRAGQDTVAKRKYPIFASSGNAAHSLATVLAMFCHVRKSNFKEYNVPTLQHS